MNFTKEPELLTWDEQYVLGIKSLDTHHQRLIQLINDLFTLQEGSDIPTANLNEITKELIDFTVYSLDFEADFLFQFEYADRYLHIEQHELFKEKTNWLKNKTVTYHSNSDQLKQTICNMWKFLYVWLNDHIAICDKQFKVLLIENGVR